MRAVELLRTSGETILAYWRSRMREGRGRRGIRRTAARPH